MSVRFVKFEKNIKYHLKLNTKVKYIFSQSLHHDQYVIPNQS